MTAGRAYSSTYRARTVPYMGSTNLRRSTAAWRPASESPRAAYSIAMAHPG